MSDTSIEGNVPKDYAEIKETSETNADFSSATNGDDGGCKGKDCGKMGYESAMPFLNKDLS